jgi:hypothetical protein
VGVLRLSPPPVVLDRDSVLAFDDKSASMFSGFFIGTFVPFVLVGADVLAGLRRP